MKKIISTILTLSLLSTLFAGWTVIAQEDNNLAVMDYVSSVRVTSGDGQSDLSDNIEYAFDDNDQTSYVVNIPDVSGAVSAKVDTTGAAVTCTSSAAYHTNAGTWTAMFDGVGMINGTTITDGMAWNGSGIDNANRWYLSVKGALPTLEIQLPEEATFNTIKWTELRKLIKSFTATFYKDGEQVKSYSHTFESTTAGSAILYLRTIELDSAVTADKIIFDVTEVNSSSYTSIVEMELWNFVEELEEEETNDVTICFDFDESVVADTLFIGSDDVESIKLFGSENGNDFFEIDYTYEDGFYRFDRESLTAIKIEAFLVDGCEELEITDIGLYNRNPIIIPDDDALEAENKLNYVFAPISENLSKYVTSSKAFDKNGIDPTNTAMGATSCLYDESGMTEGFSRSNKNCWGTYAMNSVDYGEAPFTVEFKFNSKINVNTLDIYEHRDRIRKVHIETSSDGEQWERITDSIELSAIGEPNNDVYRKRVSFPILYTQYIRFVLDEIDETSDSSVAFKLCEIVFSMSQHAPSVNGVDNTAIIDRNMETYAQISEGTSVVLDMGQIKDISTLSWIYLGSKTTDFTISTSDDAKSWEDVSIVNVEDENSLARVNFEYALARYIKIEYNELSSDNDMRILEIYVSEESDDDMYVTEKAFVKLLNEDSTSIITDENLLLLSADIINLPTEVMNYEIVWDLSMATMINPETGAVTHGEEDISGTIGVIVINKITNTQVYENSFPIVSKPVFSTDEYYTVAEMPTVSGSYDFDRPDGFIFKADKLLLEFDISGDTTIVVDGDSELFTISSVDEEITISYNDETKKLNYNGTGASVRVVLKESRFDLYLNKDNTRYKGILYNVPYKNSVESGLKTISSDNGIANVKLGIEKANLTALFEQLDFSHISDENMYSVTENVRLMTEIIGIPVTWTSSDDSVINAQTGEVNTSAKPTYVTLTASINEPGLITWSKELYAAVNLPNIISEGNISVNAVNYSGNDISNVKDAKTQTSFLTSSRNNYAVTVTFAEKTMISQVALIECEKLGNIDAFNIYVDGTLSYSGTSLDGFENCVLDNQIGKAIKIEVVSPSGITGFSEIALHSIPTDSQKAKLDMNAVAIATNYPNGEFSLPTSGEYSSTITYSSDSSFVTFVNGGASATMTVNNPGVATSANITMQATLNDVTETKTVAVILDGEKTISTRPSGSGGSGGSGGSSSAGGFSGGGSDNLFGGTTTSGEDIVSYVPTETKDELSGHWGEKEIRSLVDKGIVQGDGNGYNLTKTVSRAEFITMLIRAMEKKLSVNEPAFDDVTTDSWYADEMQTAYELGWIDGYNNTSMPTANITREEMAKIICKAMEIEIVKDTALDFTDKNEQSAWAVEYINSLYNHNIINGYEDGSFRPKNSLKRDEAMIVIYRILNKEVK